MYKVKVRLAVRLSQDGKVTGGYVRDIELPFVPQLGMHFEQGTNLWGN